MTCVIHCVGNRLNSLQLLNGMIQRIMTAVRTYLPPQLYTSVREHLNGHVPLADLEVLLKSDDSSSLAAIMPRWSHHLLHTLTQRERCQDLQDDYLKSLGALGEAWIHFGLIQTYFLAPRGPIDPNQRRSIKLDYAKQQVGMNSSFSFFII